MSSNQPVHPGRILRETVFPEAGITVASAAQVLGESDHLLYRILEEREPLTAALCLKIARLFGSSPELWMRLQANYDLRTAMLDTDIVRAVEGIVPVLPLHGAVA